jgi:hypothetical protein
VEAAFVTRLALPRPARIAAAACAGSGMVALKWLYLEGKVLVLKVKNIFRYLNLQNGLTEAFVKIAEATYFTSCRERTT